MSARISLQERLEVSGLTYWQLSALLGVHAHQLEGLSPAALSRLPAGLVVALAERLDLQAADLIAALGPSYRETSPQDAEQVASALAHARSPLTCARIAQVLGWDLERTERALEQARVRPEITGPMAVRPAPGGGYLLEPRLDRLTCEQIARARRAEPAFATRTAQLLLDLDRAGEAGMAAAQIPEDLITEELAVTGPDGRVRLHPDVALALNPK